MQTRAIRFQLKNRILTKPYKYGVLTNSDIQ